MQPGRWDTQTKARMLSGKKLILNLSIEVPIVKEKVDPEKHAIVKLGDECPIVLTVNYRTKRTKYLGNAEAFILQKNQLEAQRRRTQGILRIGEGGHGRKKKLEALNRFHEKERRYVKTYNHYLSHNIVKYAIDMNCGTIKIPDMVDERTHGFLGKWAYYELMTQIQYKASLRGINVVIDETVPKAKESEEEQIQLPIVH